MSGCRARESPAHWVRGAQTVATSGGMVSNAHSSSLRTLRGDVIQYLLSFDQTTRCRTLSYRASGPLLSSGSNVPAYRPMEFISYPPDQRIPAKSVHGDVQGE